MAASKESKTALLEKIEKRLSRLELQVGYNEDGTKNGNGIIHKVEEVREEIKNLRNDIKSYDTYLDNLSEDFIKIKNSSDYSTHCCNKSRYTNYSFLKLMQSINSNISF